VCITQYCIIQWRVREMNLFNCISEVIAEHEAVDDVTVMIAMYLK